MLLEVIQVTVLAIRGGNSRDPSSISEAESTRCVQGVDAGGRREFCPAGGNGTWNQKPGVRCRLGGKVAARVPSGVFNETLEGRCPVGR